VQEEASPHSNLRGEVKPQRSEIENVARLALDALPDMPARLGISRHLIDDTAASRPT
jgi:hypothetical protein